MRFKTTRDVLDRVVTFHQQLRDLYLRHANIADKERVKLLLDYMARHEEHLQKSLSQYEDNASERILDTWFKHIPSSAILKDCNDVRLAPDMSVEEIVKTALKFDDCLVDFYTVMAEKCVSEEVKSIFSNLLKMENQEKMKLVRIAQEVYDL